jgi:hypothetical protein
MNTKNLKTDVKKKEKKTTKGMSQVPTYRFDLSLVVEAIRTRCPQRNLSLVSTSHYFDGFLSSPFF